MLWGMAAKCRRHERMHAFNAYEEKLPAADLAMLSAVALKCRTCAEFEQDPKAKDGTKRCRSKSQTAYAKRRALARATHRTQDRTCLKEIIS